ncbi:MAG: PAS domain S-box protein, partial [Candidatus Sericytochromatia bacterium]|nr:PAS domain S-box protein [Candidatus Sericytochromatia bacterium]
MTTKTGATLTESVLATARGLTAAAALLAMLGLFHWLGAWPRLETWALQWTMMTRHTGVGLLVTTGALALVLWPGPGNARRASLSAALGLTVCAFGAWGVVGWLTHVPAWAAVWTPTGAWSVLPLGPLACALGGLAVWALDRRPGATVPPSDVLALLLGAVGAAPVTGYVVDLAAQPRLVETLGIAPSAGLGWTLCAAALLLARPGRGLAAILVATGPGGGVARRLLPIVAAVPMSLTASHLALDWAGLGGTMLGRTAQVLALMGLAFLLVLWTSYPLEASERALRDSEARLRGLVEAMPDALFVLDATGWITDANPAASTLLGLRREALLGQPLARWVTTDPAPTAPGLFDALAQAGSPDTPSTAHRPDGTSRPVELTLAPIEASGGRLEVAICRDVSERQRTAEALARRTGELAQARALERLR